MIRRGLTLLELLAAICLTSLIAVAAFTWTATYAARARQLTQVSIASWEARQSLRLLADDRLAVITHPGLAPIRILDQTTLEFDTCHVPPGDHAASGLVRWRFDPAKGTLLRRRGGQAERLVSAAFSDVHVARLGDRISLICVLAGERHEILLAGGAP